MRIGVCTDLNEAEMLAEIGFDYVEYGFGRLCGLPKDEFEELARRNDASPIHIEACNGFCPAELRLTGADMNLQAIRDYTAAGLKRAAKLGVRIVVVGSGKARAFPEKYGRARAAGDFARSMRIIGDLAAAHGVLAVVEPLNSRETNLISSVAEGAAFVRSLSHPAVGLLADFYHMRAEGESMESIAEAGKLMRHFHIANFNGGRVYPAKPDEDDYAAFFGAIRRAGADARVSIEGITRNLAADAPAAYRVLHGFCG